MIYDTDKWGGFAELRVMEPVAQGLGLEYVARAEPVAYRGEAAADGHFYAMLFRKTG